MRASLALLLLLVGGALSLPAAVAAWEQRVLTNEGRFIELGNEVLTKDAVQQKIADVLTEDVMTLVGQGLGGVGQLFGQDSSLRELTGLLDSLLGPNLGAGGSGLGGLIPGLGSTPPAGRPNTAP